MKVWLLIHDKYSWDHPGVGSTEIIGIFETYEAAEVRMKEDVKKNFPEEHASFVWHSKFEYADKKRGDDPSNFYSIREWEVEK